MAEFKKHMMYGDGKSKMANTYKEHLVLKKKGWGHKKPSSPLTINQALIENYKGVNKYTPTGGGTRRVEVGVDDIDKIAQRQIDRFAPKKKKEKEKDKKENGVEEPIIEKEKEKGKIIKTDQFGGDSKSLYKKEQSLSKSNQTSGVGKSDDVAIQRGSDPNLVATKSRRLNVKPVFKKGVRDDNMISVDGKEITVEDFNARYPDAKKTTKSRDYGNPAVGDYEYTPSTTPSVTASATPFKYYSKRFTHGRKTPLFFTQQPIASASDTIVDLQMMHPNIEQDVDKYIANSSMVGDEKLDVLGNQANTSVYNYTKNLKDLAAREVDKAGSNKAVNGSISTLRGLTQKINNLIDRKAEWIENNGGGESSKRNFSRGSSGKNKFMQNAVFSEKDDLFKMILPSPEVGVSGDKKFGDIQFAFGNQKMGVVPAVVNSSDMFVNVFLKPEGKFADYRKQAVKLAEDAKQRKPYNEYHTDVVIDSLLDSKENILAFAWDNFAGPSFVEQYTDANPNDDPTWMDVDSPNFDENRLHDEVSFWLREKLRREHKAMSGNQYFDELQKLTPKQLIEKYSN